jgi:Putative transposase/SMP-30/Gluconolactonase/LRE-like region
MRFDCEIVVHAANELGEGVLWSPAHDEVQWTDIFGRRFWAHRPSDGQTRSAPLPDRLACFAPLGGPRSSRASSADRSCSTSKACKPGFFLPVRVLSRLFRCLFLKGFDALHKAGRFAFFGDLAPLADKRAFDAALAPLRRSEWIVYAKRPFAGPEAVLAYLARYTHPVAISNSRLIVLDEAGVTFNGRTIASRAVTGSGHDARRRRVHPPLSPARAAERLPPHPPLRPVRQRRSGAQHRARPRSARRAQDLARQRACRGRQRDRNTFVCAPMPCCGGRMTIVETFEGPRALAAAEPDQDRHLMTAAAHPASQRCFSSPPAARWNSRRCLQQLASPSPSAAHARTSQHPPQKSSSSSFPPRTIPATSPRSPTSASSATPRARRNSATSYPRFPPWQAFERRPHNPHDRPARAGVRNPSPQRTVLPQAGAPHYIPKADGSLRPLGIPTLEDKIVQGAGAEVLNAVYEADFMGFSHSPTCSSTTSSTSGSTSGEDGGQPGRRSSAGTLTIWSSAASSRRMGSNSSRTSRTGWSSSACRSTRARHG